MVALSPVPEISISPAPPQEPVVEPFSPFTPSCLTPTEDVDSFRPSLLSPPPTISPRFPRQLSPLRPSDTPVVGKGLERERFEEMLRASKERNAALGGKKSPDLRKEIAIKVHKSKQVERRALFLSKIQAPPSPGATLLPKTPPESPAIFHYSLPSPGLQSPLAIFETMASEDPSRPPRQTWVEQVEFRLPGQVQPKQPSRTVHAKRQKLPSLDQITAHLSSHRSNPLSRCDTTASKGRLPTFLKSPQRSSIPDVQISPVTVPVAPSSPRRAPPSGVGRLQFACQPTPPNVEGTRKPRLPPSPSSPGPQLQIRTTVVPRTSSLSPLELTESNLLAFNSMRNDTALAMMSRLRRRTLPPASASLFPACERTEDEERKLRRHSAPPQLPEREREGFRTPALKLPGAF